MFPAPDPAIFASFRGNTLPSDSDSRGHVLCLRISHRGGDRSSKPTKARKGTEPGEWSLSRIPLPPSLGETLASHRRSKSIRGSGLLFTLRSSARVLELSTRCPGRSSCTHRSLQFPLRPLAASAASCLGPGRREAWVPGAGAQSVFSFAGGRNGSTYSFFIDYGEDFSLAWVSKGWCRSSSRKK